MDAQATSVTALDVRPILATGGEPFDLILATAQRVGPGGVLELTAPFEPMPLYAVLRGLGFSHETQARGDGSFLVRFRRGADAPA